MHGDLFVCCKGGCLPLPFEELILPCSAGSPIEVGQVDSPGGRQYLTPEGGEAEARPMLLSRVVNGESPF